MNCNYCNLNRYFVYNNFKNSFIILGYFLFLFGLIYLLNYFTPLRGDDYVYKFVFNQPNFDEGSDILVKTFMDIINSQNYHYLHFNGRYITHIFLQLFTSIIGKGIFNIINSLVFILFIIFTTRLWSKKINLLNIIFTAGVIILFFPQFNETCLWMAGSINYLWTCCGISFLLYLINKLNNEIFTVKNLFLFFPALVIGNLHEGLTMPLAGSFVIFYLLNWRKFFKFSVSPIIFGFILGSCICSFSPGIINRANVYYSDLTSLLLLKLQSLLTLLCQLKAFYFYILLLFVIFLFNRNLNTILGFLKNNIIILMALIFSFLVMLISGVDYIRAAAGVEFYSIILILRLCSLLSKKTLYIMKSLVGELSLLILVLILPYSYKNYLNYINIIHSINLHSSSYIVYASPQIPKLISNYILNPIRTDQINEEGFPNKSVAYLYNYSRIRFIPKVIDNYISQKNPLFVFEEQKDWLFYILPVKEEKISYSPYFVLKKKMKEDYPFYIKPFYKLDRFSAEEIIVNNFDTLDYYGKKFLIIYKSPLIEDRLIDIKLK